MKLRYMFLVVVLYTAAVSLITARAIQVFHLMPGTCGAGKAASGFHIAFKERA